MMTNGPDFNIIDTFPTKPCLISMHLIFYYIILDIDLPYGPIQKNRDRQT